MIITSLLYQSISSNIFHVKVVLLAGGLGTRMCEETEYSNALSVGHLIQQLSGQSPTIMSFGMDQVLSSC